MIRLCLITLLLCTAVAAYAQGQEIIRLNGGTRLVVLPDRGADTVAVQVFFQVGRPDEGGMFGINGVIARVWGRASVDRTVDLMAGDIARIGSVGTEYGDDWITLWGLSAPENLDSLLQTLLTNLVANPLFTTESIADAQELQRQAVAQRRDDLVGDALDRLQRRAFGASPYALPALGDAEHPATLTPNILTGYYHRHFRPDRCIIVIAGRFDVAEAVRLVPASLSAGGWDDRRASPPLPRVPEERVPEGLKPVALNRHGPATVLAIGWLAPGTAGDRKRYAAFVLLDAVLGAGKASRLFAALRDGPKAVGYDVRTALIPARGQSLWVAYVLGNTPHPECRAALQAQIADIATGKQPVASQELLRAKSLLKTRYARERQRMRDRAFHAGWLEAMGLGIDFETVLDTVTADDLNAVARDVFSRPSVLVYSQPHLGP